MRHARSLLVIALSLTEITTGSELVAAAAESTNTGAPSSSGRNSRRGASRRDPANAGHMDWIQKTRKHKASSLVPIERVPWCVIPLPWIVFVPSTCGCPLWVGSGPYHRRLGDAPAECPLTARSGHQHSPFSVLGWPSSAPAANARRPCVARRSAKRAAQRAAFRDLV